MMPPLIFGSMSLVSAALCLIVPETANRKLPEDVHDCDAGPLWSRLLSKKRLHSWRARTNTF